MAKRKASRNLGVKESQNPVSVSPFTVCPTAGNCSFLSPTPALASPCLQEGGDGVKDQNCQAEREPAWGCACPFAHWPVPWVLLASPLCLYHDLDSSPDLSHSRSACGKGGPLKEASWPGRVWALRGRSTHEVKMEDREACLAGDWAGWPRPSGEAVSVPHSLAQRVPPWG